MFHKIIIVGRLGADPEQKYTTDGKPSNGNKSGDTKGSYEYFKQLRKGAA